MILQPSLPKITVHTVHTHCLKSINIKISLLENQTLRILKGYQTKVVWTTSIHFNFQQTGRPRQNQEKWFVDSSYVASSSSSLWSMSSSRLTYICCSMKVREIRKRPAERCHTRTFYFANINGFTGPPAWVTWFFLFLEPITLLAFLSLSRFASNQADKVFEGTFTSTPPLLKIMEIYHTM